MDEDIKSYFDRWRAVAEIEKQERRAASVELRWQQLNAVIRMAISLGVNNPAEDENEVVQRWAKLRDKTISRDPVE